MDDSPMDIYAISFIGGGNMASAIITGLEATYENCSIHVCDTVEALRNKHRDAGRHSYHSMADAVAASKIIILAVKPQAFQAVMHELAPLIDGHLVISILAGITLTQIEAALPDKTASIRCMPNTPMAIGQGMVGLAVGTHSTSDDVQRARTIFEASAKVLVLEEQRMDAITAISGSGPAYFFQFCESLMEAACNVGFSETEAQLLVSQTAKGSIDYLCSQENFPAQQLREQVTSAGGTTEAALNVLHQHNFTDIICQAIQAAEQRSKELSL